MNTQINQKSEKTRNFNTDKKANHTTFIDK